MRWHVGPKRQWKPWFAFVPLRDADDNMVWLELIWVRWAGEYTVWCRWEDNPNADEATDPIPRSGTK